MPVRGCASEASKEVEKVPPVAGAACAMGVEMPAIVTPRAMLTPREIVRAERPARPRIRGSMRFLFTRLLLLLLD
ncbi:hypothetical protein GCM10010407_16150 [Rarobacter incanus]